MLNLFILLRLIIIFFGILFYVFNFNHLLIILLGLEYLLLILSFIIVLNLIIFIKQYILLIVFLVFCISERVLGLTVLIVIVRIYGNDYIKSLIILQC